MNYKSNILLFMIFIFVMNKYFINNVLIKFNKAVEPNGSTTQYGTVIQGVILVISYICLSMLVEHDII
jgi:hypothetical protein